MLEIILSLFVGQHTCDNFGQPAVENDGSTGVLGQLVNAIQALRSPPQQAQVRDDRVVPLCSIDRSAYLKKHWSQWDKRDIDLDRTRSKEKMKVLPARGPARNFKALLEILIKLRHLLIEHAVQLNTHGGDPNKAIKSFITEIDPTIDEIKGHIKRGVQYILRGEDSRFIAQGGTSVDFTAADYRYMREGQQAARGARGGYRSGRSRYAYRARRGRGGYDSYVAGQSRAFDSILKVIGLGSDRRNDDRRARSRDGEGSSRGCYICGRFDHFARSCPEKK